MVTRLCARRGFTEELVSSLLLTRRSRGPLLGITSQEARLDLQGAGWPLLPGALILEARDLPHFSCWLLHSPEQNQPQG